MSTEPTPDERPDEHRPDDGVKAYELLQSPCRWCGYNEVRYWQSGTHEHGCPWANVSGENERMRLLLQPGAHDARLAAHADSWPTRSTVPERATEPTDAEAIGRRVLALRQPWRDELLGTLAAYEVRR